MRGTPLIEIREVVAYGASEAADLVAAGGHELQEMRRLLHLRGQTEERGRELCAGKAGAVAADRRRAGCAPVVNKGDLWEVDAGGVHRIGGQCQCYPRLEQERAVRELGVMER
jgi:hypothetical protein